MAEVAPNPNALSQDSSASTEQLPDVSHEWQGPEPVFLGEGSENQLILWTDKAKTTPLAPILTEWMVRLKEIRDQGHKMVERIRCSAQPNQAFRGKRLVPSRGVAISDRMQYIHSLDKFKGICFATIPQLQNYTTALVQVEAKIDQAHNMFLRQVMTYSVQPLIDYVTKSYPFLLRAYSELLKSRNQYDRARSKSNAETTMVCRKQFADTGRFVYKYVMEMPQLQLAIAQAFDNYLRAELEFARKTLEAAAELKPPNHASWWHPEKTEQGSGSHSE